LENAKRQEVRTLLVVIKQLREDGTFKKSKEMAIDIAHDILKNASDVLSPRGQRYSEGTKAWLGILRTNMGRRCSDMVTVNAGLADERTSRGWSTEKQTFSCQLTDEDFAYVAKVYKGQMEAANLLRGSIPVVLAEDETKITPKAEFDHATASIVGFCGVKCAAKCTTAPMRRKKKCVDPHGCRDGYHVPGDDAYAKLVDGHGNSTTGTLARAVVLRPLHPDLKPVPILWTPTCNTFTCKDYVYPQWQRLHTLYNKHLAPIIGPIIANASDGDSRRRCAQLGYALTTWLLRNGEDIYTLPDCAGFIFSGKYYPTLAVLFADQDFIHNGKKLINLMVSPTRVLRFGLCTAHIGMLKTLFASFRLDEHGMLPTDLDRGGYNAMDWNSALRLMRRLVLERLATLIAGQGGHRPHPELLGLRQYTIVCRTYTGIFLSLLAPHLTRVHDAGFVCTCLRLWKCWILFSPQDEDVPDHLRRTLKNAWITPETFQDVLLSCHYAVLLLMTFRDRFPHLSLPYWLTGTDSCEDLFSSLGSFVQNKRVYTYLDGLQIIRSQVWGLLQSARSTVDIRGTRRRLQHNVWDEEPDAEARADPEPYPADAAIREAWQAGASDARAWAVTCGMQPSTAGAEMPAWWLAPHEHDNITITKASQEAQAADDEEAGEEAGQPPDPQDDDVGPGGEQPDGAEGLGNAIIGRGPVAGRGGRTGRRSRSDRRGAGCRSYAHPDHHEVVNSRRRQAIGGSG
jgi:hypothetical protein